MVGWWPAIKIDAFGLRLTANGKLQIVYMEINSSLFKIGVICK
jgi:hypothetical protein